MRISKKTWSKEQDEIIVEKYGTQTAKELSVLVGVPAYEVSRRAKALGVWVNTTESRWSTGLEGEFTWQE